MRLDGWVQGDESHGPPMSGAVLSRLLFHTMEGWFEGSKSILTRNGNHPHLCYAPDGRKKYQGVDTDFMSKAIGDAPGGIETRDGCIQVELEGFAAETPDWPDEWLRNIAEDVVLPLYRAGLCGLYVPRSGFVGPESGAISLEAAAQRLGYAWDPFTYDDWYSFGGICGHQHAPENGDRWDPGRLNVPRIIEHVRSLDGGASIPGALPLEDDDMPYIAHGFRFGLIGEVSVLGDGGRILRDFGTANPYPDGVSEAAGIWSSAFGPVKKIKLDGPEMWNLFFPPDKVDSGAIVAAIAAKLPDAIDENAIAAAIIEGRELTDFDASITPEQVRDAVTEGVRDAFARAGEK